MISRGATPKHTFTLPFDVPASADIRIVYAQGEDNKETILLELTTERCTVNGRQIQVKLKQEETLLFNCTPVFFDGKYAPLPVKIQIGLETPGENIMWSNIYVTDVLRCLRKDGRVCDG